MEVEDAIGSGGTSSGAVDAAKTPYRESDKSVELVAAPTTACADRRALRHRYGPLHPFFEEGDLLRCAIRSHLIHPFDHELANALSDDGFVCGIDGCKEWFSTTSSYERHYKTQHINVCSECARKFPSSRFLEMHIEEEHDPLFKAQVKRKKMYRCLVPGCKRKFWTPKTRLQHLHDYHHGSVTSYRFFFPGKLYRRLLHREQGKKRAPRERESHAQHNKSNRGMHTGKAGSKDGDSTAAAMEVSSEIETGDEAVKYSYSLPENFSLGRGRRGRGKGFVRYSAHSSRSHTKRLQRKRKRELIAKARQMDGVESDDGDSDG